MSWITRRLAPLRLARPMGRRPGTFVVIGVLVALLGSLGFIRFSVDAGTDLLVGSRSDTAQTNQRFQQQYGSDPLVIVIRADPDHPAAFYLENNVLRLVDLERRISEDSHVVSVLGPGTVALAAQDAISSQLQNTQDGFNGFVLRTALLEAALQKGGISANGTVDPNKLTQADITAAQKTATDDLTLLRATLVDAVNKANAARDTYVKGHPGSDHIIDGAEQAATKAASVVDVPPLFAEYVSGGLQTDQAKATSNAVSVISEVAAAFGDCSAALTTLSHHQPSCQNFLSRLLLDLPKCPSYDQATKGQFCEPKNQWAAVLPQYLPNDASYAIITVRLQPDVVGNHAAVDALVAKIRDLLDNGEPGNQNAIVRGLGPLVPSSCGGSKAITGCTDKQFTYTIAGVPTLTGSLTDAVTHLLLLLLPIVALVMVLLLLAVFRVRGRFWPMLAASAAALLTVGLTLITGIPVTPAVLAGIPVLVGLGVDYAVQLLARFAEERDNGLGVEAALRVVLSNTGPATLVAALATLAGLGGLYLLSQIDAGRVLVAIPLVAQFAVVLMVGVALAWCAAVLVALPAAAWVELRRDRRAGRRPAPVARPVAPPARRTAALSSRWALVLALAALPALAGWAVLPHVPVETDVEHLLARSLPALRDVQTIREQTGSANELDLYVEGDTSKDATALAYQRFLAYSARCDPNVNHGVVVNNGVIVSQGAVSSAFTFADVLNTLSASMVPCAQVQFPPAVSPTPSPSPSGSASPSASPSPGAPTSSGVSPSPAATASPSALRTGGHAGVLTARDTGAAPEAATTPDASPAPAASPPPATGTAPTGTPAASPAPTATPAPGVTTSPSNPTLQSALVCTLRLFSVLSHSLVHGITPGQTAPCPPPNLYGGPSGALSADPSPVNIDSARIPMGITTTSVADESSLIAALNHVVSTTPPPSAISGVHAAGLVALAAAAYDNLTSRALALNLIPVLIVAGVLMLIHREPRRALLPVLPTVLAAGWGPLVILLMGRLPGDLGRTLGALNPLTVILGALVVALATEFGVVLLHRFYEERGRSLDPEAAAAEALRAVGRPILVSASTLAAGFAVLAFSVVLPNSLPLISSFGLTVVIDLALAVLAVFGVMLPLAVALERTHPLVVVSAQGVAGFRRLDTLPEAAPARRRGAGQRHPVRPAEAVEEEDPEPEPEVGEEAPAEEPEVDDEPEPEREPEPEPDLPPAAEAPVAVEPAGVAPSRHFPGMTGRRRAAGSPATLPSQVGLEQTPEATAQPERRRRPGGVVPRRFVDASAAPPTVIPPAELPPAPPLAADPTPEPPPPPSTTESPSPTAQAPSGRKRRRRPPPHVRRREHPPEGG